jgi:acyl dehydratase
MAIDRFPVEASHIMMFARAIGDTNPIYYDADYAAGTEVGSIIAPPTFAQASAQFDPDYPLRPKAGQKWFGSGGTASGRMSEQKSTTDEKTGEKKSGSSAGGLHAEQHFTYHRHLKPGDVLTAENLPGEKWEKESKRAGVLKFSETITEYRDQNGELVVTARGVGVVTEKVIEQ